MNIEIRECGYKDCNEMNKVYYHLYKNATKHLTMRCKIHGYVNIQYEDGLDIPWYEESKPEIFAEINEIKRVRKQATLQKRLSKRINNNKKRTTMSAKKLLSM